MKTYDFDELINREGTNSVKYDGRPHFFGQKDVLPLWVADMDFKAPDFIVEAIRSRAQHEIYGYTFRPESYNEAIVHWLKTRHNWEIQKEWIHFSPGVVPSLAFSVMCFTEPGDSVIVQPPVYFPFFSAVKNNGRELIENPLRLENGRYFMDFEDLEKKIQADTKMLLLCNPHNPGGMAWTKKELQKLSRICTENNILVVSDEIHSDLIFRGFKHTPFALVSEESALNSITCMAPSKTFNIAGLSTSFLVIPNKKIFDKYDNLMKATQLYGGNIFGAVALEAAYTKGADWLDQMMAYIEGNYTFVEQFLGENIPQIVPIKPEATYLVWLDFSALGLKDADINSRLIKAGVGLNRGIQFGRQGKGFMRLNLGCPRSILTEALGRMKKEFAGE
ncbi:MAG: PatB family C-S lyase [Prolixibacteraceae bacterium]|jgi:cystathionine beta-lyase|nr:PatB family C-S lyase [Prolixibacteraceae bacterium]